MGTEKLPSPSNNENIASKWDSLSDFSQLKASNIKSINHNYEPTLGKEDSQPELSYTESINHNYESTPLKEDSQPELSYTGEE